jgi:diaminopimelate epimerase
MCGNGIRCIARLAADYVGSGEFVLTSGGREYLITRHEDMRRSIPTFGVRIPVRLWSDDFAMHGEGEEFVSRPIPELDAGLRFTAVNVGNPHIVAEVERVDYDLLGRLGRRVLELPQIFPHGVNVSLVEVRDRNRIFVATYERGAGITPSCGTAMTSSATAMALTGRCGFGENIDVLNRGGAVRCVCSREDGLNTTLIGNATYESKGRIEICGNGFRFVTDEVCRGEQAAYNDFLKTLKTEI